MTHPVQNKRNNFLIKNGFTLIELLLAVVILGLLATPLYLNFRTIRAKHSLSSSAEQLATQLRSAHVLSREAKEQKQWGILIEDSNTYFLVSGNPSSWDREKTIKLEKTTFFDNQTTMIWFDLWTGNTDSEKVVTVQNKMGNRIDIKILKTGVVEVSDII